MEHFARWIVKRRKLILVLAVLLLIPSVFGALGTYINYDILTYLPKNLDSMIGETYLEDDFNMASVSMITVENMSTPDTLKLKSDLEGVEGVQKVMWTSDFIDVTIFRSSSITIPAQRCSSFSSMPRAQMPER